MGNKAENLLENIRQACPNNIYAEACRIMENTKDIAPSPQGDQIKSCLEMLSVNHVDTKSIMSRCTCISKEVIEEAQALYNTANGDINTFLEMLNQNQIGGGELHMQDDKIIGIYRECYCDIPMAVENMPSCYCECSAGGESAKERYEMLHDIYNENSGVLTGEQVKTALSKVSKSEGEWTTQWSIVYEQSSLTANYYFNGDYSKAFSFKINDK